MSTYILNTFKISYMIKNNVSLLIGMRRMTIAETARLAGVSYNTIYALYHDQTAGIEFATLNKLCEVDKKQCVSYYRSKKNDNC